MSPLYRFYVSDETGRSAASKELARRFGLPVDNDEPFGEGTVFDTEQLDPSILEDRAEYDRWVRRHLEGDFESAKLMVGAFVRNVIYVAIAERIAADEDLSNREERLLQASYRWVRETFIEREQTKQ